METGGSGGGGLTDVCDYLKTADSLSFDGVAGSFFFFSAGPESELFASESFRCRFSASAFFLGRLGF